MADISKITLPSGTTYNIKDTTARTSISTISNELSRKAAFRGIVPAGTLTDGDTEHTGPVTKYTQTDLTQGTDKDTFTPEDGDIVLQLTDGNGANAPTQEFIFSGQTWYEIGSVYGLEYSSIDGGLNLEKNGSTISTITLPAANEDNTGFMSAEDYHYLHSELPDLLSSYSNFLGVTTTAITDGATTTSLKIDNSDITVKDKGSIVIYGSKEFIWNGTSWAEFGDLSGLTNSLGKLAYKDSVSASYTPAGSVKLTNSNKTVSSTASYTPAGTITHSVTSDAGSIKLSVASETLTVTFTGNTDANVMPVVTGVTAGTPTFKGTAVTISSSGTVSVPSSASFTGTAATITSK